MSEIDHLEKFERFFDLLFLIHLVPQGLEYVLDDGHVPEEREGPLKHNGDPFSYLVFQRVLIFQPPEIHRYDLHLLPAFPALITWEWEIHPAACLAGIESVFHICLGQADTLGSLFNILIRTDFPAPLRPIRPSISPEDMVALTSLRTVITVELLADISNGNQWFGALGHMGTGYDINAIKVFHAKVIVSKFVNPAL